MWELIGVTVVYETDLGKQPVEGVDRVEQTQGDVDQLVPELEVGGVDAREDGQDGVRDVADDPRPQELRHRVHHCFQQAVECETGRVSQTETCAAEQEEAQQQRLQLAVLGLKQVLEIPLQEDTQHHWDCEGELEHVPNQIRQPLAGDSDSWHLLLLFDQRLSLFHDEYDGTGRDQRPSDNWEETQPE